MKKRKFRQHFLSILKKLKNSENQNISKAELKKIEDIQLLNWEYRMTKSSSPKQLQKINLKLEKHLIYNLEYLSLELTGNKDNSSKILNQILIEYFGEQ